MFKKAFHIFYLAIVILLVGSCAQAVMPLGGEKDETPPTVASSVPQNYQKNFSEKTIEITFNEFVKLDNANKKILISPPLENNPEYKLRGKTLIIKFMEDLKPETTYSIFFSDAIIDLTEGNPLGNSSFVFSTGSVIDSLSLSGQVSNAFDLKTVEETFVMLYVNENDTLQLDSLPYLTRPMYVSRTDKEGRFTLSNLRNKEYLVFALKDANSNMMYDLPSEEIAYLDSLVKPVYVKPKPAADTTSLLFNQSDLLSVDSIFYQPEIDENTIVQAEDTLLAVSDSLLNTQDSLEKSLPQAMDLELFMYIKQDSVQRLLKTELVREGVLRFDFRYPAKNVVVEPLEMLPDSFQMMPVYTQNCDTLFWYYTTNILDSLKINLRCDTIFNDTLNLAIKPRQTVKHRRQENDTTVVVKRLKIKDNTKGRKLDVGKQLVLTFDEPIVNFQMRDTNWYITKEDTIFNNLIFEKTDKYGFKYTLKGDYNPESDITIIFPDSVFYGFNAITNDTTKLSFRIPSVEEYGNLYIDIQPKTITHPYIIQLMNDKEKVLEQRIINESDELEFLYLTPAKYKLKVIFDSNSNGRWDIGNFMKKIQPEKVLYFDKILDIRANWDFEETWAF